ncbi:cobalamin biosynthesis protein [Rhodococcus sp. TAF43]|uniref:cobalamin biosynthesis protein n=1 Tax=unclassified Rhodococcus (in: high G+C Gram-positive bacteria) TaxID=192944 RepID=UPI000E0BCAFD|nr:MULTISPECIES: cobalamin biosynthesis protein [unclassified Rhodococcus (in: high G+C Gram-positive bacteria)]QKT11145.1 cobalamin biosynthesis protein [Rhodococcus sp. W8901]RDI31407.1 cobalt-precorrin 5A hydrolase [Rhodococcus sp. AG1013]
MADRAGWCVGVGAGSRVGAADIVAAVLDVCGDEPVRRLATLDRKVTADPFVDAAEVLGATLVGYTADRLAAVPVPNPADAVAGAVGTPSVAEAAAVLAADGGRLVVSKRVTNGVTVAAARSVS